MREQAPRRHFDCAKCGEHFESDWTAEEAQAEADALFGSTLANDQVSVCDDCWRELMARFPGKRRRSD